MLEEEIHKSMSVLGCRVGDTTDECELVLLNKLGVISSWDLNWGSADR